MASDYPNVCFYENKRSAAPNNEYIEEILKDWRNNFLLLEHNHTYLQWLFPNQRAGLNKLAFPLQPEEAKKIRETPDLKKRGKRAFEMMLNFYGMKLTWNNKFELTKYSDERLRLLNIKDNHNFQRITRILTSLIEFGFHQLMLDWLKFLADLIFKEAKLSHAKFSFHSYWIKTLCAEDKSILESYVKKLQESNEKFNAPYTATNIATAVPAVAILVEVYGALNFSANISISNNKPGTNKRNDNDPPKSPENSKILAFYKNQIPMEESHDLITDVLKWKGKYEKLMNKPDYINWLFPASVPGLVQSSIGLTDADSKEIRDTPELRNRVLKAFEMMLDLYGMRLTSNNYFELCDQERIKKLNKENNHHLYDIARILSSLKHLGHHNLIQPWMRFMADLIYRDKIIPKAMSNVDLWLKVFSAKENSKLQLYILSIS